MRAVGTVPGKYDQRWLQQALDTISRDLRSVRRHTEHVVVPLGTKLILQSPDGHYWEITVDNDGTLSTTDLGTSL